MDIQGLALYFVLWVFLQQVFLVLFLNIFVRSVLEYNKKEIMPLNKIKHIIADIDGIRCSVVETSASEERVTFLKELLLYNKFDVKVAEEKKEGETKTFIIGVTDILFNPVFAVYERTLKSVNGYKVTPAYWSQQTTVFDPRYWLMRKKKKY